MSGWCNSFRSPSPSEASSDSDFEDKHAVDTSEKSRTRQENRTEGWFSVIQSYDERLKAQVSRSERCSTLETFRWSRQRIVSHDDKGPTPPMFVHEIHPWRTSQFQLDLASREDHACFETNPFSIAKLTGKQQSHKQDETQSQNVQSGGITITNRRSNSKSLTKGFVEMRTTGKKPLKDEMPGYSWPFTIP